MPRLRPFAVSALAACLLASHGAFADGAGAALEVARWSVDPEHGFTTLARVFAPDVKVRVERLIDDQRGWQAAWQYFGFRGPRPTVDFRRRRVLVFVEPAPCAGGGRGGSSVVGLRQFSDGGLTPEFEGPDPQTIICPEALLFPHARGYAYALGFPRVRGRAPSHLSRDRKLEPARPASSDECADCSAEAPAAVVVTGVDGSIAAPERGRTVLAKLGDGTPVWVVRHPDGSLTVLAADAEQIPEWLSGFRWSVTWDARTRRLGPFDEWGTHPSGQLPGLDRYPFELVEERLHIGRRAGPTPPGKLAVRRVPRPGERDPWKGRGPFEDVPRRNVRQALATEPGSLSVVEDARLNVDETSVALCSPETPRGSWSRASCAPVGGIRAPQGCAGTLAGSFALRRSVRGFADIVGLSFDGDYACETREGRRGAWDPNFAWGFERVSFAATAALAGGVSESNPYFGAELSTALRYRWLGRPTKPRSFWENQLGDTFELSLRARQLAVLSPESEAAVWMVGLAPSLTSRPAFQRLTSTTLLGALLPELGLAIGDAVRPYVGLRFELEYRFSAAGHRQKPYWPDERLALGLSPHLWCAIGGDSTTLGAGASLGISAW